MSELDDRPDHEKYPNRWCMSAGGFVYDNGGELPSGTTEVTNNTGDVERVIKDGRGISGIEV